MPLQKLSFRPGINRENTIYATEGGWYDMDKVRFRWGTPEKIGGWKSTGTGEYQGVARNLMCWASLSGEVITGVGTHIRYYINYGAVYHNITPLRYSAEILNPLNTSIGTSAVQVHVADHGANPGDIVVFSNASTFSGIPATVWNHEEGFRVMSVLDTNTFLIDVGTVATANAVGGGTVFVQFEIPTGLPVYTIGSGWSAGFWNGPVTSGTAITVLDGSDRVALTADATTINVASTTGFAPTGTILIGTEVITYTGTTATSFTGCTRGAQGSTARIHTRRQLALSSFEAIEVKQVLGFVGSNGWGEGSDTQFGIGNQLRLWSASNFGEHLIIAPRGGGLYFWTKDLEDYTRAQPLRDEDDDTAKWVPHTVNYVLVSDVSRFVIAFGANGYDPNDDENEFDPMVVRWSAQNNPLDWIPDDENQSGEQRLSTGSYIMSAVNMKQEILVWTDAALYSMQYIGPPYVWKIELSMSNLSLMGPNAIATVNNNVYWMGSDKFYVYNGRVDTLPCTVQQYVFNDISFSQRYQAFAGTNEGFNEIWWFYVSNTEITRAAEESRDPTIDKYVIFNHAEQCWYYGSLNRTAWLDTPLESGPIACTGDSSTGSIVMHEQGTDDGTTSTPAPIEAYIQSSDFDIGDGHQYLFVWRMLPDVSFNGSTTSTPACTVTLLPRENAGVPYNVGNTADPIAVTSAQNYTSVVRQYTVQEHTPQINTRVRGRAMAFRIESDALGVQWKLGIPRIDARPDGRKS